MREAFEVPKFVYNVETADGKLKTGKLYAESENDARVILMQRGLTVKSVYQIEDKIEDKPKSSP